MDSSSRKRKLSAGAVTAAVCLLLAGAIGVTLAMGKDPFVRGFVKKDFERDGLQIGDRIPEELTVTTMVGERIGLREYCAEGPTLIVTGSLTCHVSRDGCGAEIAALADEIAPGVRTVLLYTIDAHPEVDVSPYAAVEWVTEDNREAGILRRQPTTMAERTALAQEFVERTGWQHAVVIDEMSNASWEALGKAPNAAILVNREGLVYGRNGWFSAERMRATITSFAERL